MNRLGKRLEVLEAGRAGPGRVFFTTVADIAEHRRADFIAAERRRQGIGETDHHFVTIYEAKPEEAGK